MFLSIMLSICSLLPASSGLECREFTIDSPYDSLQISVCEVLPQSSPVAVVQLVHGLCGCKERFLPFIQYLTANSVACVASDIRGHGDSIRSEDDRGYTYQGGAEAVVMDIEAVSSYIRNTYNDVPFILLGHSMGSLAVRAYTKAYDKHLDGLIVCGSPSPNPLSPFGRMIVKGMCRKNEGRDRPDALQSFTSRIYNKKFKDEGYQAWTCSDPMVRKQFAEDPRCNFNITADCAYTLLNLFQVAYSDDEWALEQPDLPVIFLSGGDDPCMLSLNKFNKAVERMRKIGYKNVTSKIYDGMRHEILNEIEKELVWKDILDFIFKTAGTVDPK